MKKLGFGDAESQGHQPHLPKENPRFLHRNEGQREAAAAVSSLHVFTSVIHLEFLLNYLNHPFFHGGMIKQQLQGFIKTKIGCTGLL